MSAHSAPLAVITRADNAQISPPDKRLWALSVFGLLAILALALWFRWRYLQQISLYVDEFTTLWAASRTMQEGAPIMPSGVFYTRGLLNTYVIAFAASLFGLTPLVGRLVSLAAGLAAIVVLFVVGWRTWNVRVGWLAALGLALLPEAIEWSARARFYAQLMLFVLLAVWAGYAALRRGVAPEPGRASPWRLNLLFAALFVVALFSQEETLLVYPALVLMTLAWRGWRYFVHPPVLVAHLICLAAMGLRYLLEIVGQPGYFETIQGERPYIGLQLDVTAAWNTYGSLLTAPERWPWTLFALLAVIAALVAWRLQRQSFATLPDFHRATLFFAGHFVFVFLVILLLVGGSWRESRYLLFVQPFWLLTGAAGAVWAVDRLLPWLRWRWAATVLVAAAAGWLLWPQAEQSLTRQTEGYDRVLAWVAAQRQPGDVVMSPQPPACAFMLGAPCDYYATQVDHAAYVIRRGDALVDRWTGAPLLDSASQLETIVTTANRVWFVADGLRLGRRYRSDFMQIVVDQFEIAHEERGVVALLATGWHEPTQQVARRVVDPPRSFGPMALTSWAATTALPGQPLAVTLWWKAQGVIGQQLNTSLRVVAADGSTIAQVDGPPGRGIVPTFAMATAELADPKTLQLPANLAPGRYRLDVVAYDAATTVPVAEPNSIGWFWIGPALDPPQQASEARWENGLRLLGSDRLPAQIKPGEQLVLRLLWTTERPVQSDATVFVHLYGPNGALIAQADRAPEAGFYPTSGWEINEASADVYALDIPADAADGDYALVVGWYLPATGERVPLSGGGDELRLATVTVRSAR